MFVSGTIYAFLLPPIPNIMPLVDIARKFLGQQENPGNKGFKDPAFDKLMRDVGQRDGEAWCAYFAEMVAKQALPSKFSDLDKYFSGSAVQTFKNFKEANYPIHVKPEVGDLVIFQNYKNGKPQWSGHAGIVSVVVGDKVFKSIEGNTNNDGSREGYEVAEKLRKIEIKKNGLNVLGFVKLS